MRGFLRPFKATQKLIRPRLEMVARGSTVRQAAAVVSCRWVPWRSLQQADDPAVVHGQEGGAAIGVEEELPEALESLVQGGKVGLMEPEEGRPALPVVLQGPVVGQEWQTR